MVYEAQRKVILELADKEPCVIIGRNADYILKDRNDILNIFIHGDMPEKITAYHSFIQGRRTGSCQNDDRYRQKAYDKLQILYRTEMGKSE